MRKRIVMIACALAALAPSLSAQTLRPPTSDEVRVVVAAAMPFLSGQIAAGAVGSNIVPWLVTIPDSTSAVWRTAGDSVYALLRTRPRGAGDLLYSAIEFGQITFRGDTLVSSFAIVQFEYCSADPRLIGPAGWRAVMVEGRRVRAIRMGGTLQPPIVDQNEIVDGGCLHRGKASPPS